MLNAVKHLGVAPRRPRHAERSEASLRCGEILRFAQDDDAEDDGVRDDEVRDAFFVRVQSTSGVNLRKMGIYNLTS